MHLNEEKNERFVTLFAHSEPDIRRYIYSLLGNQADASDVLQETSLALWRKFDQYQSDQPFIRWAFRFAYYEVMAELDALLKDNADARRVYRCHVDLHFEMEERIAAAGEPMPFPVENTRLQRKLRLFQSAAAALALTSIILSGLMLMKSPPPVQVVNVVPPPARIERQPVAVVTQLSDVSWNSPSAAVGDVLEEGVLSIESGQMTLEFLSGATIALEGPAELRLHSPMQAFLVHGKLAARVPDEAYGFTVESPGAAVVDLGTEFALNVNSLGISRVHVLDG